MKGWTAALFWGAVIVGALYLFSGGTRNPGAAPPSLVAGWDDLDECSPMTSFDGRKALDFDRDHKVDLTEEDNPDDGKSTKFERKTSGTWSYDEEHRRFTIIMNDRWTDYTLMRPEGSDVCILAVGDLRSVNITESWFGTVYVESLDDRDRF
jgi:hypothetical protein